MKKIFTLLMAIFAMVGTAKADVEWTIWGGDFQTSNTPNGWDNALSLDIANFANLEKDDVVYVYASQDEGTHDGAQQSYAYNCYEAGRKNPSNPEESQEWYWADDTKISGSNEIGNLFLKFRIAIFFYYLHRLIFLVLHNRLILLLI